MRVEPPDSEPPRPSRARFVVLGWMSAAALMVYLHRAAISVPEKTIRQELDLTIDQMGWIMAAFQLAYLLGQLPGGYLGDRMGARRMLPLCVGASALATAAFGFSTGLGALVVSRLVMGAGQAGVFPAAVGSFGRWFPPSARALPNGLLTGFMSVGTVLAAALTGRLLPSLGWRGAMLLYALPAGLWCVGFWWWFRDRPSEHSGVNVAERELIEGETVAAPSPTRGSLDHRAEPGLRWSRLVRSPQMWLLALQHGFRAAAYMFFQTWFPTFLQESRGVSIEQSGDLTGAAVLGVVASSWLGGAISDWLLRRTGSRQVARRGLAVVGLLGSTVAFVAATQVRDGWVTAIILGFGALAFGVTNPVAYTLSIDLGGRHVASVFSVMNTVGNLGGLVTPLLVPWLVRTLGNWNDVLWFFAALYLAAAVCFALLNAEGSVFDERSP